MNLEEKLQKEKQANFIKPIEYNNKQYIMALKTANSKFQYLYFELDNNEIKDITDENVLKYLKEHYEFHLDIVY